MKCLVCNETMQNYFTKKTWSRGRSDQFVKCPDCGLVVNQTLYEATDAEWQAVQVCG